MSHAEREALRRLFGFRCGYCGVAESDVGSVLTVDHFHPLSRGGPDVADNQVYCCLTRNVLEGSYWAPDSPLRVLHPLRDDLVAHVVEGVDGMLHGITETGVFHIGRLHLNRPDLVVYRREHHRLEGANRVQRESLRRLARLEEQVEELMRAIGNLGPPAPKE